MSFPGKKRWNKINCIKASPYDKCPFRAMPHSGDNESNNNRDIKLDSYQNAKNAAETGLLIKAVNHLPGVVPMPYQLPKLDPCDVHKITIWIKI